MLPEYEREKVIDVYLDALKTPSTRKFVVSLFAQGTNMREQTLAAWPRERLVKFVAKRGEMAIPQDFLADILRVYFAARWPALLETLFRSLNLESDEELIPDAPSTILPEAAESCITRLLKEHPARDVRIAVEYLRLLDERWEPLLGPVLAVEDGDGESPLPPVTKDIVSVMVGFTKIDRVVMEQVIATSSHAEAALDEEEIDDLVQTLIALNPRRKRSYFVLGYADVLIAGRTLDFGRAEFDDERRSWYLAGVLLGLARQHRTDELTALLQSQAETFRHAATTLPGLALARALLPELVRSGRIGGAALLVSSQLRAGKIELGQIALDQAVRLLRGNAVSDAMALIRPLWEEFGPERQGEDAEWVRFRRRLARRVAQGLQALGDFPEAETLLAQIAESGSEEERARVWADRGLVAGRFRSVFELSLPSTHEERRMSVAALKAGESCFLQALELMPGRIVSPLHALGLLNYLEWRLGEENDATKREAAIGWLQGAVTEMRMTDTAPSYERSGLLGQALFMLTVLLLHRFTAPDLNAAAELWRQITADAGKFPEDDLRLLLEVADMTTDAYATSFAESIWNHRRQDALALVLPPGRLERSSTLRGELTRFAADPTTPRQTQRRIWMALIPVLLRLNEREQAEQALDALEDIAEGDQGLHEVMQFLSTSTNYEPAWTEQDALWSLVRLARKAGDDDAAARYLRTLFYRVRDTDVDVAREIVELMSSWQLDAALRTKLQAVLPVASVVEERSETEGRLRRGEAVRVVFVGGNETQARYDERVRASLVREFPGIQVTFRHTGWSSNWGQMLPGLVKECNEADAVVLMTMMRTMLGCRLRAELRRPWVSCAARGEMGLQRSIVKAASVALAMRANVQAAQI